MHGAASVQKNYHPHEKGVSLTTSDCLTEFYSNFNKE
jgi:hypothetical protein